MCPGFSVFLPIILRTGFNYSVKEAQYLAIPGRLKHRICSVVVGVLTPEQSSCGVPSSMESEATFLTSTNNDSGA